MEEAIHGISGACSGMVALSILYPLDNLRLRQQSEILNEKKEEYKAEGVVVVEKPVEDDNEKSVISIIFSRVQKYFSENIKSLQFARNLIAKEGFGTFYRGISSAMVGIVVAYGVYFWAYKYFKNLLLKNNFKKGIVIDSLITSFLAACVGSVTSNPIWVLNSRMSKNKDKTNWQMIKQIIKEEGVGGFFKGVLPALILTANPVIQFVLYEFLRSRLLDPSGNISGMNIVLISIISKLVTTFVTYPMVTVKTLFQVNENKPNKEIIEILKNLMKNEGVGGFYKGISAKIVQTLMNNVILMLTYEKVQKSVRLALLFLLMRQIGQQ